MTTPQRIYVVTQRDSTGPDRLIRAPNTAQALRHAAADTFRGEIASPDTLVKLVQAGTKVEDSGRAAVLAAEAGEETPLA